jgi:hypothetical protein
VNQTVCASKNPDVLPFVPRIDSGLPSGVGFGPGDNTLTQCVSAS